MKNQFSKINDQEFAELVKTATNVAQVVRKLNLAISGSTYKIFYKRIKKLNLNTSHFVKRDTTNATNKITRPLEEILVQNSDFFGTASKIKQKLIRAGLKKDICELCGNKGIWMNKPIILQLEHINGIHQDNRIENLQILCPNCHSQTPTWGNKKRFSVPLV